MNRELDAECARAMGINVVVDYHPINGDLVAVGWYTGYKDDPTADRIPDYSTNPTAARLLEDEIERRGLQDEYVDALMRESGCAAIGTNTRDWWAIIRATPEQRARAFLEATKQ